MVRADKRLWSYNQLYLGKANVVAHALRRKSTHNQPVHQDIPKELKTELEQFEIELLEVESWGGLNTLKVIGERQSDLRNEIIQWQDEDPFIKEEVLRINEGKHLSFI